MIGAGMNTAITNPLHRPVRKAILAADLLLGHDEFGVGVDRRPPRGARGRPRREAGEREGRGHLPPQRQDRARAGGHDAVQRRALGGAADRVHLRRPGHLRQVQRAGDRGRGRAVRSPTTAICAGKLEDGWRLSCQCPITGPMTVDVPRLMKMPKAATMGVEPVRAAGAERREALAWSCRRPRSRTTARTCAACWTRSRRRATRATTTGRSSRGSPRPSARTRRSPPRSWASTSSTWRPATPRDRMFGASFDIGTTTCVCTLVDLRNGATVAVASTINHQAPFGADVMRAHGARRCGAGEHIEQLQAAVARDRERAPRAASRRRRERRSREEIYEAVVVGNATMLHLLCGVNPESIAVAPYVATFLEPQDLRADQIGFAMHPLGWVALFPSIGAYVGADIVADIVATGPGPRPADPAARRRRHERRDRVRQRRAARRDRRPGGPGVRGRRDRVRDARDRGRDRGGRPHERPRRAAGDRRRRGGAPRDLRLGADRHRRAAAAGRGCSTTAAR